MEKVAPRMPGPSPVVALSLPTHRNEIQAISSRIVKRLLQSQNALPLANTSGPNVEGSQHEKLLFSIANGQPIVLVILGFPAKSPNREKTLGDLPDLGEVEGLRSLENLCRDIQAIHRPGARVIVCSDGHVFSDLIGVSDETVDRYHIGIQEIIRKFRFSHLSTFSLRHIYGRGNYSEMRDRLLDDYGESIDWIRQRSASSEAGRSLFNGIHRFVFEDRLSIHKTMSRNRNRVLAKETAYRIIQRSHAFSCLVQGTFSHAIRLSIHPQPVMGAKIGIKLLPSDDRWATPWHNVLLRESRGAEGFRLVPQKEAVRLGGRLKFYEGYAYFDLGWEIP